MQGGLEKPGMGHQAWNQARKQKVANQNGDVYDQTTAADDSRNLDQIDEDRYVETNPMHSGAHDQFKNNTIDIKKPQSTLRNRQKQRSNLSLASVDESNEMETSELNQEDLGVKVVDPGNLKFLQDRGIGTGHQPHELGFVNPREYGYANPRASASRSNVDRNMVGYSQEGEAQGYKGSVREKVWEKLQHTKSKVKEEMDKLGDSFGR